MTLRTLGQNDQDDTDWNWSLGDPAEERGNSGGVRKMTIVYCRNPCRPGPRHRVDRYRSRLRIGAFGTMVRALSGAEHASLSSQVQSDLDSIRKVMHNTGCFIQGKPSPVLKAGS
jgi:hypothetical protein